LNIAQIYERARRYKEAEQAARLAEAVPALRATTRWPPWFLPAQYSNGRNFSIRRSRFKKALEVNPKSAAVLNYYVHAGRLGIRLEEAQSLVQRAAG